MGVGDIRKCSVWKAQELGHLRPFIVGAIRGDLGLGHPFEFKALTASWKGSRRTFHSGRGESFQEQF